MAYLLGFDLGSSSVKASLIHADTGILTASASSPASEMDIESPHADWAEQDPELWWKHAVLAVKKILQETSVNAEAIKAIGISYQMHGLVLVDKDQNVLRPAIIWCDSRAVGIGENAFQQLGETYCIGNLLNSPGNFTASKLKWVRDNEPFLYKRIHKCMLPGDYLAMRLTGEIATTIPGLSEGVMWDYPNHRISHELFDAYDLDKIIVPKIVPTFSDQGHLTAEAARSTGLKARTPVTYRAGDQPNNAFSLNALNPGEIATTAGTSGVIFGVVDTPIADKKSRVNTFVHVNHTSVSPRLGVMLCVNGTGILNRWLKNMIYPQFDGNAYEQMNSIAMKAPAGSDGLTILPFGNGAERVLQNRDIRASFHNLDFNRHQAPHLFRAAQEGIVFALGYGFEVLNSLGIQSGVIRAGNTNMFLSDVFCQTFTQVTNTELQLFNTDGAQGAARGAGVGAAMYASPKEAFSTLSCVRSYQPDAEKQSQYKEYYQRWKEILNKQENR